MPTVFRSGMAGVWTRYAVWRKQDGFLLPAPLNAEVFKAVLVYDRQHQTVFVSWPQLLTHFAACKVKQTGAMRAAIESSAYRKMLVKPGPLLSELKRFKAVGQHAASCYLVGAPALAAIVGASFLTSADNAVSGATS